MITLTGFTDEASADLDKQIEVTKALGWSHLSLRTVGDGNIHNISDAAFEVVCEKLSAADLKVAEFGTIIGSWSKTIDSDWQITLDEIDRCIPRMQQLGVQFARVMSFAQNEWGTDQLEAERFRRLREITARFKDAGLEALHENCMNWGGFSADHTLRLLDEVPGLRLVFDTGNPIFQRDRSKSEPAPWQDPYEFYTKVKHAIAHIHVKDAIMHAEDGEPEYVFAGEGQGRLKEIMTDVFQSDYDGFIAIEPHMGKVFHLADEEVDEDRAYEVYLEFGRRVERLVGTI